MDDLEVIANLEFGKAVERLTREMQERMENALAGKPSGGVREHARLQVRLNFAEQACKEFGRIWQNLLEERNGSQLTRENAEFIIQKVMDLAAAHKSSLGAEFPERTSGVDSEVGRRMDGIVASIRRDLEIRIRKQQAFPPKRINDAVAEEAKPTMGLSPSDKLAIALTCLAGIMAIILFLVAKTPAIVVLLLIVMVGLAVYPILHFFQRGALRIVAAIVVLGVTALLGWHAWPSKNPSNPPFVEVPATFVTPSATQSPSVPANPSPSPTAKAKPSHSKAAPLQPPMSQECAPGASCAQSSGQQGGITAGVYNGPPPLELKPSLSVIPSDTGRFQFPVNECPVKTQIIIVPNQAVPPPIEMALEFDKPVSKISGLIQGVNSWMLGGPQRLGTHALTSLSSPGISPSHPFLVEVCSSEVVKLVAAPHLE
jgi:hypothetical protein